MAALTPSGLVRQLAALQSPVLTWRNAHGDRLELTGRVFANWVFKSAGLLHELEVGPDLPLVVIGSPDQPLHWRALAALLAAQTLGAQAVLTTDSAQPGVAADRWVAIGDAAESHRVADIAAAATEVLLYDAAPLALSTPAEAGFIDFISAVRAYPDQAPLPADSVFALCVGDSCISVDAVDAGSAGYALKGFPLSPAELLSALGALAGGGLTLAPPRR